MRVFLCIVFLSFFVPAPVWADNPIGQAVMNTAKANMDRRGIAPETQELTFAKLKELMALPSNKLDSWIRIARALGIPGGHSFAQGGSFGGAGAWGDPDGSCVQLDVLFDFAGNLFVPSLFLKGPAGYSYGSTVWYSSYGGIVHNTNNPAGAIKVFIHMRNAGISVGRQWAPTHYSSVGSSQVTVTISTPAYYDVNGSLRA